MSWNLFKGLQPRKTLPTEKDVARECTRIQHVEDASKKLFKEGKKLSEATVVVGKAGAKIGTDLNVLAGDPDDVGKFPCAHILENAMDECEKFSQDKNVLLQKTLVDPMKRYNTTFPQLNAHMKAHDKAQQEYKRLQGKVDKLKEKEETGPNMVKMQNLKKDLAPVKDEFDSKHNMLLDEFPAFYNSRLQYLQPIFESLVMSQCWYHHELYDLFDESLNEFGHNESQKSHDEDVQEILEQIRALSITKD